MARCYFLGLFTAFIFLFPLTLEFTKHLRCTLDPSLDSYSYHLLLLRCAEERESFHFKMQAVLRCESIT